MKALDLLSQYRAVRRRTVSVCAPLAIEDHVVQSMPDASPAKWHLAHTSWFFEAMVLAPLGEPPFDPAYDYLFNSYYDTVGARVERACRGQLTRPGVDEVLRYRAAIDHGVAEALGLGKLAPRALEVVELGLHHEQQHQELILTDIKHAFGHQPLQPAYRDDLAADTGAAIAPLAWVDFAETTAELGAGRGFAFDNERPRHRQIVPAFALATRPIANAEVLAFIGDRGYTDPRLWLANGFAQAQRDGWQAPLYWQRGDGGWLHYTLGGVREVDPAATACHLSYYEADAIARWASARLPTEAEWELAAAGSPPREGNWADDDRLAPRAATSDGLAQLFGDVWEWTASAYGPYPGFRPLPGALAEYNGKFMSGQMVLRGGSCLTPRGHARASYRNFFPPAARWQMTGARLARDGDAS